MHPVDRRGFTLIELMVALVLLGIVTAGIYRVLVSNQRMYHAQVQRIDLQQNIRAAATILPAEFREIASTEGDIYGMAAREIRMRAMRQFAVICDRPDLGFGLLGLPMTVFRETLSGPAFQVGDSILMYYEGDEGSRNDDVWWPAQIKTITGGAVCPGGWPGFSFQVDMMPEILDPTGTILNRVGAIPDGAPLRGFQAVRYALYQSPTDMLWYLGLEVPIGARIQPLVGPLSGDDGLLLRYFNSLGGETAARDSVALIEIHVRGRTVAQVQGPGGGGLTIPIDSLTTRVALRNNRRFGPGALP